MIPKLYDYIRREALKSQEPEKKIKANVNEKH